MEDAANNCCAFTTLRNCGCGFAPHLKAGRQVYWPSRYFHLSLLLVVVLIWVSHHCLWESCLLTMERRASCNLQCTLPLMSCAVVEPQNSILITHTTWSTHTLFSSLTVEPHNDICYVTWMSTTPTLITTVLAKLTPCCGVSLQLQRTPNYEHRAMFHCTIEVFTLVPFLSYSQWIRSCVAISSMQTVTCSPHNDYTFILGSLH